MSVLTAIRIFSELVRANIGTILVGFICLLLVKLYFPRRRDNLPPGLYPWPVFGNLWELSKDPRDSWPLLRQKYGDIVSVYMGGQLAVILNSLDVIKEAFSFDSLAGRPKNVYFFKAIGELKGIASSSGELWKEQRKFSVHLLRQFGMGRQSVEDRVSKEVEEFLDIVRSHRGNSIDVRYILHTCISNVIFSVVFGKRFSHSDSDFKSCQKHLFAILDEASNTGLSTILPWLEYLPDDLTKHNFCMKHRNQLLTFFLQLVNDIRSSYDCTSEPHTFVEAYLQKIEEEVHLNLDSSFNVSQLLIIITDLFFDGTETTSTTLKWALLHIVTKPEVQAKIQQEIDYVTNGKRSPSMRDRVSLPFTEAFICEVQRYSDIIPNGGPHAALDDIYLRGYLIPKDTIVFANLHLVLHDKTYWGDPEVFRPERFLDEEGNMRKHEQFIPFAVGKRVCIGESLARTELFRFITAILQNFTLRLPDGADVPDFKGKFKLTVLPPPFGICAEIRELGAYCV